MTFKSMMVAATIAATALISVPATASTTIVWDESTDGDIDGNIFDLGAGISQFLGSNVFCPNEQSCGSDDTTDQIRFRALTDDLKLFSINWTLTKEAGDDAVNLAKFAFTNPTNGALVEEVANLAVGESITFGWDFAGGLDLGAGSSATYRTTIRGVNIATPDTATEWSYAVDINLAVPEPSTWLMMLAGFALTGFALKRRKTVSLA